MKITPLTLILSLAFFVSCTRSHQSDSARVEELGSQSTVALNARDYSTSQRLAAEATRLDPKFAEAWVAYGMSSIKLGQTNEAREAYERALSLYQARLRQNPSDSNQALQQIFLLALLGRFDEAEAVLKRAHIEYPSDNQISTLAGNFAAAKKDWESWSVPAK